MIRISAYILFFWMLFSCSNNGSEQGKATAGKPGGTARAEAKLKRTILFFGNSLTAGYGLDPVEAFPALIGKKIDSLGLPYKVVNAGVSGETSSGGNGRIEWILKQPVDIFVLELGANDGLRGISTDETLKNLQAIIEKVKTANPAATIIVAGMQVPPSMGQRYTNQFNAIFPKLSKDNNALLIPFLLEGVGGEVKLNQEDGIHPTAEGHQIVAANVWKVLGNVVKANND
jgi:acyl-CoA thioesterase-1